MRILAAASLPCARWFMAAAIAASAAVMSQEPSKPVVGTVAVAGGELHFELRGEGPSIVLLSGGPGFGSYLQPVAEALALSHRCILFDQRGTGASQSEKPDADSLALAGAIADLEALRLHLKLGRWSLLGHSWGGMLAMAYATQHPDRLDNLVLVGTGGPTLDFFGPFGDTLAGRATPEEVANLAKWNDPVTSAEDPALAAKERLRLRFPAYFYSREKAAAAWPAFAKVPFTPATYGALITDLQRQKFDLRRGLEQVRCPTLVVHGRQDPIPASVVYEIRDAMPQLELRFIEKSGHFPWLEQPEETFSVLRAFLAKH
jgi:proline iminopeptidase